MNIVWLLKWADYDECAFPSKEKAIRYVETLYNEHGQKCRVATSPENRVVFEYLTGGEWVKSDATIRGIPLYT